MHKRGGGGGPSGGEPKRQRPRDDEEDDFDFDDLVEDDENMQDEEVEVQEPPEEDMETLSCLGAKDMEGLKKRWMRPPLPPLDPAADELSFQQIETDYEISKLYPEFSNGSPEPKAAVIRMFGVTAEGNSVVAHVHGFRPYFYVRVPTPNFGQADVAAFKAALNAKIKAQARRRLHHRPSAKMAMRSCGREVACTCAARAASHTHVCVPGAAAALAGQLQGHDGEPCPRRGAGRAAVDHALPVRLAGALPARRHRAALRRAHVPPPPRRYPTRGAPTHIRTSRTAALQPIRPARPPGVTQ